MSKRYTRSASLLSLEDYGDIEYDSNMQNSLFAEELELLIKMIVEEMPSQQRAIFKLSRFEHISTEEIAEQLNISPKTVRNQIGIALKDIKNRISIYFMTYLILNIVAH